MKNKALLFALATLSILASSCAEEIYGGRSNKKEISVKVETEGGATTKASGSSWTIADDVELTAGELTLTLSSFASLYAEDPFESQVETKGTIVTTDNIAEKIGSFNLFIPEAEKLQSVTASATNGEWAIIPQGGVKPEWPEAGGDIDFYAYTAGANISTSSPLSFSYTGSKTTASEQTDLLYTHTRASKNDVEIHFYHALSAVRFVVSALGEDYNVKSIKIKNVANSGTATYVGGVSGASGTEFEWTNLSGTTDYTQSYTENVHTPGAFFDGSEVKCTFFVIPQSVESLVFELVIADNIGNEYPVETVVPELEGGWKSGYYYTYGISGGFGLDGISGQVSIDIAEDFTGSAKSNVKGVNDGQLKSYVRAAVVANWCNSAGKVVKPWDGTLTAGSNWVKSGDFYYYSVPVAANAVTESLFTETISKGTAPEGLHLEVHIAMQAVEYDPNNTKVKAAWPEASSIYNNK